MITKLTQEQQSGIKEWYEKCLAIGRDSSPVDKETAKEVFCEFYRRLNKPEPSFWWAQSPFSANVVIRLLFRDNIGENIRENIRENIEENIWDNIWRNIRDNIGENIKENIGENIGRNIGENIRENIRDNIGRNIGENIRINIGQNIRQNIWENIGENPENLYCWGQHDINWIAYYLYYNKYGLLSDNDDFCIMKHWFKLAESAGWCYTFEKMVFVCEKPKIFLNSNGQLHKDGGMALEYSDGWGFWVLNGVRVPQWIAETRDTEIDAKKILEIDNAEVRREFIRKVGIDRIVGKLGAKIQDEQTYHIGGYDLPYQLLNIDINGSIYKALKMQNPSLPDVWHVEFVPGNCNTVLDAFNFRCSLDKIDNEKGADWYLHGDVVIKPKEAKIFKQFPKLIA